MDYFSTKEAAYLWWNTRAAQPVPDGLPERMPVPLIDFDWMKSGSDHAGWNACLDAVTPLVSRLQAERDALQQRLTVADEQVDILSGGLRLITSFGSGTNIAGVKTVAKQTLNRAAGVSFKSDEDGQK